MINHKIRFRLGLSFEEYAMIEFIEKHYAQKKAKVSYDDIFVKLGIEQDDARTLIRTLIEKKFIHVVEGSEGRIFEIDIRWKAQFEVSEEEFEEFWTIGGKPWPGSKIGTKKKYIETRRKYSKEYIFKQARAYFKHLTFETWKKPMGGEVFINIEKERFREDWTSQIPSNKPSTNNSKPLSKEEKDKLYE